jgi:hypothetical protein
MIVWRPVDLFNIPERPFRPASPGKSAQRFRPASRGKFNASKSLFYELIEPRLEKVKLGKRAVAYTDRSVERVLQEGIATASAERAAKQQEQAMTT